MLNYIDYFRVRIMIYFNSNIIKAIFLVLSIQVLLAGITSHLLLKQQNKLNLVINTIYSESNLSFQNNRNENHKDTTDENSDQDKKMMTDKDDSSEQTETSLFSKVIDQETPLHFKFSFSQTELVKFLYFNSKNKIQFHPEFSTPPPKNTQA